jgi:hypothetical protein
VSLPEPGDHARFSGTWALNRERDRSAELHPTWHISGAAAPAKETRPAPIAVTITVPASVPSGGRLPITVAVERPSAPRQLAGVRLLLEFVPDDGRPVRWRVATTNRSGAADLDLVAIDPPGSYTVWAYATDGSETGSGKATYEVTRTRVGDGG